MFAVLVTLLAAVGGVYALSCAVAFAGLFLRRGCGNAGFPTVTVIVPARNAADTIGPLLDDLLSQEYPPDRYDIVVVDDCSEDGTRAAALACAGRSPRFRLIETRCSSAPYRYKKRAVFEGIRAATGEIVATVDADCRVPAGWLREMTARFAPAVDLVAGMVLVEGDHLLGRIEALEFGGIQAMAAGLMNAGFPVTCNGANLFYRRTAFERVRGFESIGTLVSGDDDLLMQKMGEGNPRAVRFVTDRRAAVRVAANPGLASFFRQRTRWASKIVYYPSRRVVALLAAFYGWFALLLGWGAGAAAGLLPVGPFAAAIGCKLAGDLLLSGWGALAAGRPGLLALFLPAEIVHIPYILAITVRGRLARFEWRGRRAAAVVVECEESVND